MTSHLGRAWSVLRLVVLPVSLALPLAAACGGDAESNNNNGTGGASSGGNGSGGSTGGGGFDTGIDDDKNLDDLTPDEVQQLCDKTEALVDETLDTESQCELIGVMAGVSVLLGEETDPGFGGAAGAPSVPAGDPKTTCSDTTEQCLAAPPAGETECGVPEDCDITVGEYEECVGDLNAAFGSVLTLLPACEEISEESLLTLFGVAALLQPASCEVVNEKCPGALPTNGIDLPAGN